jgi:hypothetical protein
MAKFIDQIRFENSINNMMCDPLFPSRGRCPNCDIPSDMREIRGNHIVCLGCGDDSQATASERAKLAIAQAYEEINA